ncbi:MAG: AMP-binding protein [Eubacteriales bacterium]
MEQTSLIAQRLKWARNISGISTEEMAKAADITPDAYAVLEEGESDFSFTFLFKCAKKLGMDISELVGGTNPTLSFYNLSRKGQGMPIRRKSAFDYRHIAPYLKNRAAEPFVVTAKYDPFLESTPITLSSHDGQELDYIISGKLKVQLDDHIEYLEEGDSVYYDSSHRHGMVAVGGSDCVFLAVVFKEEYSPKKADEKPEEQKKNGIKYRYDDLVYKKFVNETFDDDGCLSGLSFKIPQNFNFAYDVVDFLAKKCPKKRAILWLSEKKEEKDFTFGDISLLSNRAANMFRDMGIKKGDRVMLVLKRHYQFWISIIALHKIGAVALPATSLLLQKDYEYRFNAAEVKAIVCTAEDGCPEEVEKAESNYRELGVKIICNGERPGWKPFNKSLMNYPDTMERVETSKDDPQIMYFTSGTTGYPKVAVHDATYPLGHIVTARWWQTVDPEGVHWTISETGWGKALWGKIYGQWLCETCVFVYDFNKFSPPDILPLFGKYSITSFCAPPTMYRYFIKEDLSKYDFSTLEYATTAGEALNPEVFNRFKDATGIKLMEGFGQTETTMTLGNLYGRKAKIGSLGLPNPGYVVDIMKEDGSFANVGEVGEIVLSTKVPPVGLFLGYYNDKETTDELWHDGYYHTRDTAWRDEDGYYWYVSRLDDVIKSSGYRIGPFEIESVIMELPYVLECAVTGEPDEIRGQVVKATVVLTKDKTPDESLKKEIQDYVKTHTAPYKYPRIVDFADSLPKTISGKIKRNELRKQN